VENTHNRKHKIQTVHCAWEWDLTLAEFNAVKYIERAGDKHGSTYNDDINKAIWYLVATVTHSDVFAQQIVDSIEQYCKDKS
jgi:hypothetical protein